MWGRVKVVVHHLPLRAPSQSIRTMSAYAKFKKSSTRPVRKRPIKLPEDLQPTMVKGKWRKPRLSGRVARQVKKKMIAAGGNQIIFLKIHINIEIFFHIESCKTYPLASG